MDDIKGVYPVIPIPFDEMGAVAESGLRSIFRSQIERGCPGVILFGIASEFYKLSADEERRIIEIGVEECATTETALIVSITQHATRLARQRARYAVKTGAAALMLLPPYFLNPSPEQIIAHTRAVAGEVDVPVIVQYAPEQTGVAIPPESFVDLAESVPTVSHVKVESQPPGPYISELLALGGGTIDTLVGYGGLRMIEAMDRGAVGVIPGTALSDVYLEIDAAYRRGDRSEAIDRHADLLPLLTHLIQDIEMFIHYEKQLLVERNIIDESVAHCRSPAYTPDDASETLFDEGYDRVNLQHDPS